MRTKSIIAFGIIIMVSSVLSVFAQESINQSLIVKQYKLENGLTVYLNEDHSSPKVAGAIIVKGGAKRDPKDATGIAHYLEHMLFKGTQEIGTIDFEKEKVFLDSIVLMYDLLGAISDEDQREKVQQKINDLSLKASEFAIPNEMDKMLEEMGGSNINAFTNHDCIAYYNMFPGNQIEKWLEIYSNRFTNPVFRLFQSELETVFEEKNRALDNMFRRLLEEYSKNFYKNHPYGQQSVLGEVDHIKNPSLTKMKEYFNTYYVANNMALILTGDINVNELIPLIDKKFGKWKSGEIPTLPEYPEKEFEGRELFSKRMTPIKVGVIGFRTVPLGHPDEPALDVCNALLSNYSSTGLLDKLGIDNKLLGAGMENVNQIDHGGCMLYFIPKIFGQSLNKAEKIVLAELEKIKTGNFDETKIDAIKLEMDVDFQKSIENVYRRFYRLIDVFLQDKSWKESLAYNDKIQSVTLEDVIRVAKKYYGENYLVLYSKMGFPKKNKIKNPKYEPIIPQNAEVKSDYRKMIEVIEPKEEKIKFINFNVNESKPEDDVFITDISNKVHFYSTPNPINDIFSLKLKFGVGTHELPRLKEVSSYIYYLGTDSQTVDEFKQSMQNLGSSFYAHASQDYFSFSITGLDKNFEKTLELFNEFFTKVKVDESKLKKLVQDVKANTKFEKKEPGTVGDALKEYAIYGKKSRYLDRLTVKETKKLNCDSIISTFKKALKYELDIHYVGNIENEEVIQNLKKSLPLNEVTIATKSPIYKERNTYDKNTILFVNDKKSLQSHIHFVIDGEPNDRKNRVICSGFNKYFGSGMSAIVFQEIREFRSLAYSSYAYFSNPFYENKKGYLRGFLGTQADKSVEAIATMSDLLTNMPEKPNRIDYIKSSLEQSLYSSRPTFRWLSSNVEYWRKKGYTEDPKNFNIEIIKNLEFEDITDFYKKNISGKPILITIVGDKRSINFEDLEKYGEIIVLKKKDIFRK
ncbi:MAG: insulinase family protein [Bacteroidetes bacterium]|mgnify:CR=1 FL=1|jgi:zinc protease|nr:insulinase family protein [Bacteroidota bacterium]MBT6686413.1 insulinase family protein [Bacteroidota bacterium]MBT7142246.1 insulinase family protein [Bacteroidota bacterium]MBT7491610.1 insulinase family protein [Bacteroidota bacterium]